MENKELREEIIDKITGIEYRLEGDYYIPNITVPKPRRTGNIGKYGRMNNIKNRAEEIILNELIYA